MTCGKGLPFSVPRRARCLTWDKSLNLSDHKIRELGQKAVISKVPAFFWFCNLVSPPTKGFFALLSVKGELSHLGPADLPRKGRERGDSVCVVCVCVRAHRGCKERAVGRGLLIKSREVKIDGG